MNINPKSPVCIACFSPLPQDTDMRRLSTIALLSIPLCMIAGVAAAQDPALIPASGTLGPNCNFITGEFDFDCVPLYVGYLIQVAFAMTGGFALMEIIKGGYQIGMGGITGDKEAGKKRVTWALAGLALSILSFLIVDFAISTLLLGPVAL